MKPRGLKWRRFRHKEPVLLGTHQWWMQRTTFAYQVCQYLLGVKYGSPEAKSHEYSVGGPGYLKRLIIYDDAGRVVLDREVTGLQRQLNAVKRGK